MDFKSGSLDYPDYRNQCRHVLCNRVQKDNERHATYKYIRRVNGKCQAIVSLLWLHKQKVCAIRFHSNMAETTKRTIGRKEILTLAWQDETVAGIPEDEIRTLLSEGSGIL